MLRFLPFVKSGPLVAVVRLSGMIAAGRGPTLNDATVAPLLERAFRRGKPKAVALVINSPGGSPTQSSLIASRVRRLSAEKGVPVFAFLEDVAASGGYYLASAADEIWADENSIVGSIGVISSGFGFHEFIQRHGIERRIHTSGRSKGMLDPFRPERDEDVARLKNIQEQVHEAFVAQVKRRRGSKLADDDALFTGEIWVGEKAQEIGLVDGIGHLVPKMKERFGDNVRFSVHERRRGLFARFGMAIAEGLWTAIDDRVGFARFGL